MSVRNIDFDSGVTSKPAIDVFLPFPLPDDSRCNIESGLSSHVRRLQKKNQGISRWLAFAVLGGTIVAFAMVQYAIR
jgi:hypothetical protein